MTGSSSSILSNNLKSLTEIERFKKNNTNAMFNLQLLRFIERRGNDYIFSNTGTYYAREALEHYLIYQVN